MNNWLNFVSLTKLPDWFLTTVQNGLFTYLRFSYLHFFFGGKGKCLHANSMYKIGKRTFILNYEEEKAHSHGKETHLHQLPSS